MKPIPVNSHKDLAPVVFDRIYFILILPRFLDIFGSIEAIAEKLLWLPD